MRIAHFIHRYPPAIGGAESYFCRLSEAMARMGHQVTVFTTTALDLTAFWNPRSRQLPAGTTMTGGVEVKRYPLFHLPFHRYLFKGLSLFPQPDWQAWTMSCSPMSPSLWQEVNRCNQPFDIVHASALPYTWPILAARRLAQRQQIPFLITPFLHLGDLDQPNNPIRRAYTQKVFLKLLRSAQRIFVQTEVEQQALQELGFDPRSLILQGMGIGPDDATGGSRQRFRQSGNLDDKAIVIGHLANLSKEKGTIDLLQAYLSHGQLPARAQLVLAGEEMPNFQRYWQTLPQRSSIHHLGRLTDQQKRDFLAGIDLLVLPSRVESFGLVVLEAWSNRKPVIVYRAGGLPGVVRDQQDGLVVPSSNPEALGDAMMRLVIDEAERTRLGEAGWERVKDHWTEERSLGVVVKACEEAISNR